MSADGAVSSPSLFLEQLTWPEVELALTRGMTSAVLPVGAVEQHGPHLPLFVDAERGTALGLRVARLLGDALVAPTVRVGCSDHHMGFAGTLTLRKETLEAVLIDLCRSLAHHGFLDLFLVPSHGGNFQPIQEMLPRIREAVREIQPACRVFAYTDLLEFISVWRWVVEEEVGLGRNVGGHADVAESSEMLFLHPDLVRLGRVERGRIGELDAELVARVFEKGLRFVTPNGILGDPTGMDAQLGERLLEATAILVAEKLREEADGD
jgi:creatinine amidohydrolase